MYGNFQLIKSSYSSFNIEVETFQSNNNLKTDFKKKAPKDNFLTEAYRLVGNIVSKKDMHLIILKSELRDSYVLYLRINSVQ